MSLYLRQNQLKVLKKIKKLKRHQKKIKINFSFTGLFLSLFFSIGIHADVSVVDDLGNTIQLSKAANRIISLSPHITELLYAAGAENKIVGAVQYSDYPEIAKDIPRVGDTYRIDIEKIVSMEPDLIVAWQSGNSISDIELLMDLEYPVFISEPDTLITIADTIDKLGELTGTQALAQQNSQMLIEKLNALRARYSHRDSVSTFYQFWHQPIFTVNGDHLISEIIDLCGGRNIYADLAVLSTQIDLESVLERNPAVIIASGVNKHSPPWLSEWAAWPSINAVSNNHIYAIPPDIIQRHTPRVMQGAEMMCEFIDLARENKN